LFHFNIVFTVFPDLLYRFFDGKHCLAESFDGDKTYFLDII